ncbi:maleylpyruvate isomerase family mycothiol-dependent enzyme [Actinoplanes sp. NPDC049599]|uniref:maleylpyruvate isomerase family mycothiol-dependent enzyme n=1 Tax=Actinoplanes sp. NPDC049599 TaxID=3363903 RepID=UPI0037A10453
MFSDIDDATDRLLAAAARLTDDDVRQPSRLPGWTRGHVLTHLARGANALRNVLLDQPAYASQESRDAGITAGATRSAADLVADLASAAAALRATAIALPADQWQAEVTVPGLPPFPKSQVLLRRLVELELHHVDLGIGYTGADWPKTFTELDLPEPMHTQRAERLAYS